MSGDTSLKVPVVLSNGAKIRIEATSPRRTAQGESDASYPWGGGEREVASIPTSFDDITKAIEGIAEALSATVARIKPKKTSVEFGLEVVAEASGLSALIVKGSGTANLKVTLEWSA
jgi:hypothetical protein